MRLTPSWGARAINGCEATTWSPRSRHVPSRLHLPWTAAEKRGHGLHDLDALDAVLGCTQVHQQGIAVACRFGFVIHKGKARFFFRGGERGLAVLIHHTPQALPVVYQAPIWRRTVTHRKARQCVTNIFERAIHRGAQALGFAFLTAKERPRDFPEKPRFVLVLLGLRRAPGPCGRRETLRGPIKPLERGVELGIGKLSSKVTGRGGGARQCPWSSPCPGRRRGSLQWDSGAELCLPLQLLLQLRKFLVKDFADVPGIYFTHEHELHP